MKTRREFLQDLAFLAGAAGVHGGLLSSIQRAAAIEPQPGTSFLDAEHVVILMQENRSFDHAFGTLRGVRGFNDPRAIPLPDGNPVWVQTDAKGAKYAPFRLDIKDTKTTWMGCLPHGWADQTDAANKGLHDRWLQVKRSGNRDYAEMPLTMGHYTREDIPFYYALADAFTICDQHFCSTLTGTTPNRLHLWTGTSRRAQTPEAQTVVRNEDCRFGQWADWGTFPERLEDHGIDWKIYQNELSVPTGLGREAGSWLGNFGCNPIEWFNQYHVRFHPKHRELLAQSLKSVTGEIDAISKKLPTLNGDAKAKLSKRLTGLQQSRDRLQQEIQEFTEENFKKLSAREKSLHERAFVTNLADPSYRELEDLSYQEGDQQRRLKIPKGDVLHQFRQDVQNGTLPTVSWLVPAGSLSDHPSYAWYGQWYLSEVLNILTGNPELWKKTIFILTYDENDGYYDHVPPFQAPWPQHPETGRTSQGLDTALDFLEQDQDRRYKPNSAVRDNSLGLGFRVPMIIASPWSRGGAVCSQVFDHTSVIQFVEKFASHKSGKDVREPNITDWRRTVCGDLTSAFRSAADPTPGLSEFVERIPFMQQIYNARYKELPSGFHALSEEELAQIRKDPSHPALSRQEPGTKPSCPLPYELAVEGGLDAARKNFVIRFEARQDLFKDRSAGAPFIVYAHTAEGIVPRHYAVEAGKSVEDAWPLKDFEQGCYALQVYGPNGFFREFRGGADDPGVRIDFDRNLPVGTKAPVQSPQAGVMVDNRNSASRVAVTVKDHAYGNSTQKFDVSPGEKRLVLLNIEQSAGWHDFSITVDSSPRFEKRYAGRVETGQWGTSDPAMGMLGNS
jgi:phospholipase C